MKKKNLMITVAVTLALGIAVTFVGCGESGQKEQEAAMEVKDTEKKTTDNKKENDKVQDEVITDAETDVVEENTENKDGISSVVAENETSSNESTRNPSATNTSTGNSGSASSSNNTGNNGSASSNNNTANNNSTSSGNTSGNITSNSTPVQPTHTHTWVHVDATGHYETVTIQDAWDEEIPVYENVEHSICNVCGADVTGNASAHSKAHALAYEGSGWHAEWRYEQTGTQIVHHDAVTEQRWVEDKPAYDVCSGCGAIK